MNIKYTPFLYIPFPPSRFELNRAKENSIKKRGGRKVNSTFVRWDVEKVENQHFILHHGRETVYVNIENEIKEKRGDRVFVTSAGLAANKEVLEKFGKPQFAFGIYYEKSKLFLMDDIFEWSHHRIPWVEVRTAEQIINKK